VQMLKKSSRRLASAFLVLACSILVFVFVPVSANTQSGWIVSTDKSTYVVGDTVIIQVSPTPAYGVKVYLVVMSPSGSQSTIYPNVGQSTASVTAGYPPGEYRVQLWGQAVTFPTPPAELLASCSYSVRVPGQELNAVCDTAWGGPNWEYSGRIADDDGNLYLTGVTWSFGAGESDAFLLKLDKTGTILWAKTWGTEGYEGGNDICVENNAVYVASNPSVLKFSKEGELLWSKRIVLSSDTYFDFTAIKVVGDEIYVGSLGCRLAKLVEHDDSVGVVWALNTPNFEDTDIELYGSFVYVAYVGSTVIAKFTSNGGLVWAKDLQVNINDISVSGEGIFVAGSGVCKLDLDGNVLWAKQANSGVWMSANAVQAVGGYVYVVGEYGAKTPYDDGFVIILDSNGNTICNYAYGGSTSDWFLDLLVSNGRIYASGNTFSRSRNLNELEVLLVPTELEIASLQSNVESLQANTEDVQGVVTSPRDFDRGSLDVFVACFALGLPQQLPDLTFNKVGFDKVEPFKEGDVIYFGAEIVNRGDADASNFRVEVYLDGKLYDSGTISLLRAGQSVTLWAEYPWTVTGGLHTVRWAADTTNAVIESNETNNEMSRAFTVGPVAEWTVMAYLDGDNDVEWRALEALNQMETIGSTSDVTILALVDRHPKYDSSDGNWATSRLYKLVKDNDNTRIHSELLEEKDDLNMGDSATLSGFVKACINKYPAKKYALMLFDHGGGWQGVCEDWTSSYDSLRMSELKQALQETGRRIDVIVFEACLMGMIEVAYQIKDSADFMVGSEDYMRPHSVSLPYDVILGALRDDPAMSGKDFAKTILDKCRERNVGKFPWEATLSAIDLSKIGGLAKSVDDLARFLKQNLNEYKDEITDIRSDIARTNEEYGKEDLSEVDDDYDYIDLYYFAQLVKEHIKEAQNYAEAVMNKIDISNTDSAVIAEWHQSLHGNSHGLSIWFAETTYGMYNRASNLDFAHDLMWDEFVNQYTNEVSATLTVFAEDSTGSLLTNVIFSVDGQQYRTPKPLGLMKGNHRFHIESIVFKEDILIFDHWEDETGKTLSDSTSFSYYVQEDKRFHAIYESISSGTGIELHEDGHKLFLHVYDGEGRHVGMNHALNQTEIQIPEAYYYDSLNGTITIIVPSDISKLRVVVDASYAEEPIESFNLTAFTIADSQISETKTLQSTIQQGKEQAYTLSRDSQGEIAITPSGVSPIHLVAICVGTILLGFGCYFIVRHRRREAEKQ